MDQFVNAEQSDEFSQRLPQLSQRRGAPSNHLEDMTLQQSSGNSGERRGPAQVNNMDQNIDDDDRDFLRNQMPITQA